MRKKRQRLIKDPVQRELDAIKRLLMLLLIKTGTKNAEIAKALKMDAGDLTRMMPVRQFERFKGME